MSAHRICPEHRCRLDEETLRCPRGHSSAYSWEIVDGDGRMIGSATYERGGELRLGTLETKIANEERAIPRKPFGPCRNKHNDWVKKPTGRWCCNTCAASKDSKRVRSKDARLRRFIAKAEILRAKIRELSRKSRAER